MTEAITKPKPMDLLWGAAAIGEVIGRTPKQVFHMLESGHIPPARKKGGKWVVSESKLREFFEAE
jgi:hypothetical protein